MNRYLGLLSTIFFCATISLAQTSPAVTAVYTPLVTDFQTTYVHPPIYQPGLVELPNGYLEMITLGNCLGNCTNSTNNPGGGDTLWRWRRAPSGSWADANGGITPSMSDQTTSLGELIPGGSIASFTEQVTNFDSTKGCQYHFDPNNPPKGAVAFATMVRMDNKIFMAFNKGDSDWWSGEVWWAVSSDDGANWSVYPNPILYGYYHRWHKGSGTPGVFCNEGIGGIALTTTTDSSGKVWFHIYASYGHPDSERNTAIDPYYSTMDFRFGYNPQHPFGFGTGTDLWYNGAYRPNSGKFVWSYDAGPTQTRNDGGVDDRLSPGAVQANWFQSSYFGVNSIATEVVGGQKYYILLIDGWRSVGDPLHVVTSCDGTNWSAVQNIDTSAITNIYPGASVFNNGIWYGTLSGTTSLWGFLSLGTNSTNIYDGTKILPVKIDGIVPRC